MSGRHGDDDADGVANQADPDWSPETEEPADPTRLSVARGGALPGGGLDAATLREAMGASLSLERYAQLLPAFAAAMIQAGCTTRNRAAMWCAQLGHESLGLRYMQEIWGPTAAQRGYEGRRDLGNTQPGDGARFKGHGPIQITGRANHTAVSKWAYQHGYVPTATYFVDHPDELAGDRYGFLGAVWYWTVARSDINALCDRGDVTTVTRRINGGTNGLADREDRWNACLRLGDRLLPGPAVAPPLAPPPTVAALMASEVC